jgi:hypothetical protein
MDSVNKQISACLDGELPAGEAQLLLRRVAREAQIRATFARYALVGEAMRNAISPELLDGRFAERVSGQLAGESSGSRSVGRPGSRLQRVIFGSAVAAAVAVLAIRSLTQVAVDGNDAGLSADAGVDAISYTVPQPPDRMTSYLLRHGNSQVGVVRNSSWARAVIGEYPPQVQAPVADVAGVLPDKAEDDVPASEQAESGERKP